MTGLPQEIAEAFERGAEVVTANQRSARTLRRAYDEAMRAAGHRLWQPAAVLAIHSWMSGLWHRLLVDGRADRMLLNRSQEHQVWRTIVAADPTDPQSPDALADLAATAFERLCLHNGQARLGQSGVSIDTRAFVRWAQAFERRCAAERWLSSAQLPGSLRMVAERGRLPLPSSGLELVGFDVIPPAYQSLFAAVQAAGFPVVQQAHAAPSGERLLFSAGDDAAEMYAAAHWARKLLERDATARIGIVVADLRRPKKLALSRVFREVLTPELEEFSTRDEPPFEFSLGDPLADTSPAATAFDLLRWQHGPLSLETVSALVLSPWFGASLGASERLAAAEFDAFELRRTAILRPEVTLRETIALVERSRRHAGLGDLLARLRAMRDTGQRVTVAGDSEQSHAAWADAFRAILEAARWTRRAGESSLGFQTIERWESALDELATLDFDGSQVTSAGALHALERIGGQTIFAPESHDAPVQVMGPLEAAGSRFDALWVLGADDLSWPPRPQVTRLLSFPLQRSLQMPGADAARDEEIAAAMAARLAASASRVVFSYAERTAQGSQRPAPVLAALGLQKMEIAAPAFLGTMPLLLEECRDDLPLPPFPDRVARGGAQVLQLQAVCGFRAFAERRLSSSALDTREPGLDARERGRDVHAVMEAFWSEVHGQEELRQMLPAARSVLLEQCIDGVIARNTEDGGSAWDAAYLDTQRKRLRALLRPWLDQELARPPFLVKQREAPREAPIGSLRLSLKFDRIDETEGGDLILDYKTGKATPNAWLSDRPDEPQLPLYAVLSGSERLGGVAFAVLRAGDELCLKGFATGPEVLDKPVNKLRLDAHVEEWRRVLTGLSEDFVTGDARVDPKGGMKGCRYCQQRLLCRLDTASLHEEEEDEYAEASDD